MAPPNKKAKLSPGGTGTGSISKFFGPKKTEADSSSQEKPKPKEEKPAAAKSPDKPKAPADASAGEPKPAAKPAPKPKAEPKAAEKRKAPGGSATPTKEEPKQPGTSPTPEKPQAAPARRVATACTGRFQCSFSRLKPTEWQQYNKLYKLRLSQLSGAAQESAKLRWSAMPPQSFLKDLGGQLNVDTDLVVAGVLFKELKARPNIIEEYKGSKGLLNLQKEEVTCLHSEKDCLWLEDAVMRIQVEATQETIARLATGLVISVKATFTQAGTLKLLDYCFPRAPLPPPLPSRRAGPYLALASGLHFGSESEARARAIHFLRQGPKAVQQVLICGGLFPEDPATIKAALPQMKAQLAELLEDKPLQVMPGPNEPSNASLPQLPFHSSLLQLTQPNFQAIGNPCSFNFEGLQVMGSSGQPVKDLLRCAQLEPLEGLELCLQARHLAPTAPDTLMTQPFEDKDPFVLDAVPHVLFSGGHARAAHKWREEGQGGTQCICVPSFSQHPALVLVNLHDPRDVHIEEFLS